MQIRKFCNKPETGYKVYFLKGLNLGSWTSEHHVIGHVHRGKKPSLFLYHVTAVLSQSEHMQWGHTEVKLLPSIFITGPRWSNRHPRKNGSVGIWTWISNIIALYFSDNIPLICKDRKIIIWSFMSVTQKITQKIFIRLNTAHYAFYSWQLKRYISFENS